MGRRDNGDVAMVTQTTNRTDYNAQIQELQL